MNELFKKPIKDCQFVILDLETTGGNPEKNKVIEIHAIRRSLYTEKIDSYGSLAYPDMPIPPIVTKITGISDATVSSAPPLKEVMLEFFAFLQEDDIIISHNVACDRVYLEHYSRLYQKKEFSQISLCSHILGQKLWPESPQKSLSGLAQYLKILPQSAIIHRAKEDTLLTWKLFYEILQKIFSKNPTATLEDVTNFQGDYASCLKMGWGVLETNFSEIPKETGLLHFLNNKQETVFITSTLNGKKDARGLTPKETQSRQLAKGLLSVKHIAFTPYDNISEALCEEALILYKEYSHVTCHPMVWHQKSCLGFYWQEEANGMYLGYIGLPSEKTLGGYGHVSSFDVLRPLSLFFEQKKQKIFFSKESSQTIFDYLEVDYPNLYKQTGWIKIRKKDESLKVYPVVNSMICEGVLYSKEEKHDEDKILLYAKEVIQDHLNDEKNFYRIQGFLSIYGMKNKKSMFTNLSSE